MTKNATNTILMVRPIRFGMNAQTAVDNFYQQQDAATDAALDNAKAQAEFDAFVPSFALQALKYWSFKTTSSRILPTASFQTTGSVCTRTVVWYSIQ